MAGLLTGGSAKKAGPEGLLTTAHRKTKRLPIRRNTYVPHAETRAFHAFLPPDAVRFYACPKGAQHGWFCAWNKATDVLTIAMSTSTKSPAPVSEDSGCNTTNWILANAK